MATLHKALAIAGLIIGLAVLLNNYFFIVTLAADPETGGAGQVIWDILDPLVVIALAAIALTRAAAALRDPTNWAANLLTIAFAVAAMLYLHNYLIKLIMGWQAAFVWVWYLLVPMVVVLFAAYAIAVFRRDKAG